MIPPTTLMRLFSCAVVAATTGLAQVGITFYGTATPGCVGIGTIGANSVPVIGNSGFAFTCAGAMPLAPGGLLMSFAPLAPPAIMLGAAIWVNGAIGGNFRFVPMNGVGAATVPLAIPPDPALPGTTIYSQFAWIDPGFTCAGTGLLAATNGMQVVIQGCPPEPGEPNGTCATATSIAPGSPATALICPAGDEDWYTFSLAGASQIVATMVPPAGQNYNLELRSGCSTVVVSSANATGTETIMRCLSAGTYQLRVFGASGANSATASYSLSLATTAAGFPPLTITSGQVACLSGTRWHPVLHTTTFVNNGPCPVTARVTVTGSHFTTCGGASYSIDYASSSMPFPVTIAGPSGSSPFSLTGTFTAQPGVTYEVGLVTGFAGGACSSTCGGTLTIQ